MQLTFLTSQLSSYTNITLTSSRFARNSASLGGSFLILSSSSAIVLPLSQIREYRGITLSHSQIEGTSGYFGFFSAFNFSLFFLNSSFVGMEHVLAIELHNADVRIEDCHMEVYGRAVSVRYVAGLVSLKRVAIEGLVESPAVAVMNRADIALGLVYVEDLTIVRSALSDATLLTCSVLAVLRCASPRPASADRRIRSRSRLRPTPALLVSCTTVHFPATPIGPIYIDTLQHFQALALQVTPFE